MKIRGEDISMIVAAGPRCHRCKCHLAFAEPFVDLKGRPVCELCWSLLQRILTGVLVWGALLVGAYWLFT